MALKTATSPSSTMIHSSTRMRMLTKWSLSSLRKTTPTPWRAEPSRCMTCSCRVLEVTVVDQIKTRGLDREAQKAATRGNHSRSRIRANITLGVDAHVVGAGCLDRTHARQALELLEGPCAFGFQVDIVADAKHLLAELADGAKQRDFALVEQRNAIANALHPIEQVRGQKHRHAAGLQVANDLQQLGGCLRIEARRRLVEAGDLRLLHQDLGEPETLAHAGCGRA